MPDFTANLSLLFNEVALENRFKAASHCGFQAVEIQFPYSMEAEVIRDLLEQNRLKLVLFNVDADDLLQGGEGLAAVPEKQSRFREAVAEAVEYAKVLKPESINVLPGRSLDIQKRELYLQTFLENLTFALKAFTPLGIKTVFEGVNTFDMPDFIIHNGEQMLDILGRIQHPDLYIQYDIYHMVRMRENVETFIMQHADQIGHIQFADVPGRGQPGSGNIDFDRLFDVIDQAGYSGWVGAEYKPTAPTRNTLSWLQ